MEYRLVQRAQFPSHLHHPPRVFPRHLGGAFLTHYGRPMRDILRRRFRPRRSRVAPRFLHSSDSLPDTDCLETLSKIPIATSETVKFEPPALINGKAFPAKGRSPTIT